MPIIHSARIEQPDNNLLPRSKSDSRPSDYVVLIAIAIIVPLVTISVLAMRRFILLYRPTEMPRNSDRAPRKLRKRRSIKVRNQTSDSRHDHNENDNSVDGNIPDDINLSLLPTRPSVIRSESMNTPAPVASENSPLMRGSVVVSTTDDSPPGIGPSSRTQLEELEERVQRLEGRYIIEPSGAEDYQNDIRAEDPLSDSEEQLPPYTPLPEASSVVPRVVSTSSGWKMIY